MEEFHLVHLDRRTRCHRRFHHPLGYPLSRLCRRAGKPAAVGWLAGSVGVFFLGPIVCVWWLALSQWHPPETNS